MLGIFQTFSINYQEGSLSYNILQKSMHKSDVGIALHYDHEYLSPLEKIIFITLLVEMKATKNAIVGANIFNISFYLQEKPFHPLTY